MRLKVTTKGRLIDSLDVLGKDKRLLCSVNYRYQDCNGQPRISSLVAQLPERPIKIGDPNLVLENYSIKAGDIEYVAHKGGRTYKVSYENIKLGDRVVKLPTFIEVRTTSDNGFLRSARLFNYKLVDMTRQQAWEAAQAFARSSDQYLAFPGLALSMKNLSLGL